MPSRTHWFYVPAGTRRFAYITTCNQTDFPVFHRPDGTDAPVTWQGPVAIVDVPPGQDHAAWSLSGYCGEVRFENLPNFFAYREDQLLVPADAL